MTYTRVWTQNNPPGSQAASTADDEIRNLRNDIEERMAALVTGWATAGPTDPVVPLAVIKGNVIGKTLWYHHSAFEPDSYYDQGVPSSTFTRLALYAEHVATDANVRLLWVPLVLPVGVNVTAIGFLVNRNGVSNMTCRFLSNTYTTPTPSTTVIGTASTAINGVIEVAPGGGLPLTTLANNMYYGEVSFPVSQPARLYGLRLVYDTPDCRVTL